MNDELLQVLLNQRRHAATTLPSSTASAAVVAPLCIKGDPLLRSEAVLCSGNKTYGLKRVETSNSRTNDDHYLLVTCQHIIAVDSPISLRYLTVFSVPPFATTACITSICSDYYEVMPASMSICLSIAFLAFMHQYVCVTNLSLNDIVERNAREDRHVELSLGDTLSSGLCGDLSGYGREER